MVSAANSATSNPSYDPANYPFGNPTFDICLDSHKHVSKRALNLFEAGTLSLEESTELTDLIAKVKTAFKKLEPAQGQQPIAPELMAAIKKLNSAMDRIEGIERPLPEMLAPQPRSEAPVPKPRLTLWSKEGLSRVWGKFSVLHKASVLTFALAVILFSGWAVAYCLASAGVAVSAHLLQGLLYWGASSLIATTLFGFSFFFCPPQATRRPHGN